MAITADQQRQFNKAYPLAARAKLGDILAALQGSTLPATTTTAGIVRQGAVVANAAGATPTAAEFLSLLTSLRTAGIIAT